MMTRTMFLFGLLAIQCKEKIDGGGWGNVSVEKSLMYEDIDMGVMLQLAVASFKENLAGFIDALPLGLQAGGQRRALRHLDRATRKRRLVNETSHRGLLQVRESERLFS